MSVWQWLSACEAVQPNDMNSIGRERERAKNEYICLHETSDVAVLTCRKIRYGTSFSNKFQIEKIAWKFDIFLFNYFLFNVHANS